MTGLPQPGRRNLLALLLTLPATVVVPGAAQPVAMPAAAVAAFVDKLRLLVAGPADGVLNRWADALLPALEQSLPPDTSIRRIEVGSADGVTGANQFEVRGAPDGQTVMLDRARPRWPGWSGIPARNSMSPTGFRCWPAGVRNRLGRPTVLAPDGRARVAAGGPVSPDLVAMLGIQLLGANMEPVFGLAEPAAAQAAFAQGAVDAVLVHGHRVPEQAAAYSAAGALPLFALSALDDVGRVVRDPAFPAVPHFAELFTTRTGGRPGGALYRPGVPPPQRCGWNSGWCCRS